MKGKKFSVYLDEDSLMLKEVMQKPEESDSGFFQRMISLAAFHEGFHVIPKRVERYE